MLPKIKFKIDPMIDLKAFFGFNNKDIPNKIFLDWALLNPFPELTKYKDGDFLKIEERSIKKFIKRYYLKNRKIIIENLPKWIKVFGTGSMGYPEHRKIATKLTKKWSERKINVDELIKNILEEVKGSALLN